VTHYWKASKAAHKNTNIFIALWDFMLCPCGFSVYKIKPLKEFAVFFLYRQPHYWLRSKEPVMAVRHPTTDKNNLLPPCDGIKRFYGSRTEIQ
jgi:hypothetical protein